MGGLYGVEDVKILLRMLAEGGRILEILLFKRGLFGYLKLAFQLEPLVSLLIKLRSKALVQQLKELDKHDRDELVVFARKEFDLKNDNLEATIERSVAILAQFADIVDDVIEIAKYLKK